MEEATVAKMIEKSTNESGRMQELRSLVHDATKPHHERDFVTLCLAMRKAFGPLSDIELRILDIDNGSSSVTCYRFNFGDRSHPEERAVYLLPHKGHMRWANQTTITRPKEWEEWLKNCMDIREACTSTWIEYLQNKESNYVLPLTECKTCHERCKLAVDQSTFGGLIEAVGQTAEEGGMLKGRRGVIVEIDNRKLQAVSEESDISRPSSSKSNQCSSPVYMEGEKTPSTCETICREVRLEDFKYKEEDRHQGSKEDWLRMGEMKGEMAPADEGQAIFYFMDDQWFGNTVVGTLAKQYMCTAKGVSFSSEKAEQVAELGDRLTKQTGSYCEAARQLQKCNLEERMDAVQHVTEDSWAFPSIAEHLLDIMKNGVCTEYYGPVPLGERQRGFPYQPDQTWELVKNLWKLVSKGKMLLCASATVSVKDDVEATPRNLTPRRNP